MNQLNCLNYQIPDGPCYQMVVLERQPYYRIETKDSFGMWQPFVMLRGTQPISEAKLPHNYDAEMFESFRKTAKHQILPLNYLLKENSGPFVEQVFPLQSTFIHYIRLTNYTAYHNTFEESQEPVQSIRNRFYIKNRLNDTELQAACIPVTIKESSLQFSDPDATNQWLVNQGARDVAQITGLVPESPQKSKAAGAADKSQNHTHPVQNYTPSLADRLFGRSCHRKSKVAVGLVGLASLCTWSYLIANMETTSKSTWNKAFTTNAVGISSLALTGVLIIACMAAWKSHNKQQAASTALVL